MEKHGSFPHGIEILVKKAAVDPAFRRILLKDRREAARSIDLALSPAESVMLESVAQSQLESMIAACPVDAGERSALLGRTAAVILAALTAGSAAFDCNPTPASKGIQPDRPEIGDTNRRTAPDRDYDRMAPGGMRPDHPGAEDEKDD
jgi:hypothetical protein